MSRLNLPFSVVIVSAASLLAAGCGLPSELESVPEASSPVAEQPALPHEQVAIPHPAPVPVVPSDPTDPSQPSEPTQPGDPLAGLPSCAEPILTSFDSSRMGMPGEGSEGYVVPGPGRLAAMDSSIKAMLAGDTATALTWAATAEYTLCRGTGTEADLVFWKPSPGQGQAWIVFRTGPSRPAIFEAPHPFVDEGTVEQSAYLFERLKGRVLITSGTHRCANSQKAGCSGSTGVCGSNEPYRISDMAHTEESLFHQAHVTFSEHFASDWVLSMHGMAASGASISNGTTDSTNPASPSAVVALAYAKHFSGVTTCNAFTGVPTRNHLCATSTPQGRHLNGSANACTDAAPAASGRFIHVEQNKSVRNDHVGTGDAMEQALPPVL